MTWQKVKLETFLEERENRIKPQEAKKLNLKRIEKITQHGEIFLSNQESNTNMILVKKGDLVISGIGIGKGSGNSLNIYEGDQDVLATIHYSSYKINEKLIRIDFLKTFLKSNYFKKLLHDNSPNGIKAEIKAKHILPIEIYLPDKEKQKKIIDNCNKFEANHIIFEKNIGHNLNLIKRLCQQILQEAVQGKLVKQNPKDEPASEILKKIKTERELLFDIPKNWIICELKDVAKYIQRGKGPEYSEESKIPVISQKCIQWAGFNMSRARFITLKSFEKYDKLRILQDEDLLWNSTGEGTIGRICSYYKKLNPFGIAVADSHVTIIRLNKEIALPKYILIWLSSSYVQEILDVSGSTNQTELATSTVKSQLVPLPPLSEQKRIVEKVDKLMAYCDELEKQVKENQKNSGKLMEAVLKESFEN